MSNHPRNLRRRSVHTTIPNLEYFQLSHKPVPPLLRAKIPEGVWRVPDLGRLLIYDPVSIYASRLLGKKEILLLFLCLCVVWIPMCILW